jgi:hypothetical protein
MFLSNIQTHPCAVSFLAVLYLDDNILSGKIPSTLGSASNIGWLQDIVAASRMASILTPTPLLCFSGLATKTEHGKHPSLVTKSQIKCPKLILCAAMQYSFLGPFRPRSHTFAFFVSFQFDETPYFE